MRNYTKNTTHISRFTFLFQKEKKEREKQDNTKKRSIFASPLMRVISYCIEFIQLFFHFLNFTESIVCGSNRFSMERSQIKKLILFIYAHEK